MSDEEGPDPNQLRRHMKKMLTEFQYRQKYRRIDFYRPNAKQLQFHNTISREVMLRAGNQIGKTHAGGAQMTFDLLGQYPEWYKGRKFLRPPPLERPFDFIAWAGCTTQSKTRDGIQLKLLGPLGEGGGLGTGLIPLDHIVGRPTMSRGQAEFADTVTLTRESGGKAIIRFKTYDQGREGWQGEPCDEVWLDEDPGNQEDRKAIYGEVLARLTATGGRIIITMTPLHGPSALRRRFREKIEGTAEIIMGIKDCLISAGGHISDDRVEELIALYPENERETRLNGADMQGEGAVFVTPVKDIQFNRDPAGFPNWWRWLWAVDFRHSGSATTGHPFAAVLACHDVDLDRIYITHAIRMRGLAPMHVAAIKSHPYWYAPVAWPHDGGRGASLVDGDTIKDVYKKLGLFMRPTHATFPNGGFNTDAGIVEMENRFAGGKLAIASHLTEVFDEYLGYHRVNGIVNKVDDDLLSAIRVAVMDIRYAKRMEEAGRVLHQKRGLPRQNSRNDWDIFTGQPL